MLQCLIRKIEPPDCDAAAQLSAELGYPAEPAAIRERLETLLSSSDRVVYVACISGVVVGWIEAAIVQHLATGAHGEIAGLIVASGYRSQGIGQMLVSEAEKWAIAQAAPNMIVRSRVSRESAHRFYLREGYSLLKTSAVFSKQLGIKTV